jgi:hypothetical protein
LELGFVLRFWFCEIFPCELGSRKPRAESREPRAGR